MIDPHRTIGVMRGMTHGLLGFASFLTVLAATLVPLGILAYLALAGSAVVVQLVELRSALHRPSVEGLEMLPEAAD